ncbi:CubicO group peptidase, beta-lactamase class C family [Soonwooa buanensis]|uniref:CubicO group peptidase, beta-lactamase class C family n=1 Tax=Soonwooa buanensis TaxID=619805 RepID=A0A1T5G8A1_9FLAO|nr:serine hydrolase domain-containing protein [Soonwooa buanensis]SKC04615.1 CubicO group peptidase, beta-lactamase class C family [Soonwooa buanensis]
MLATQSRLSLIIVFSILSLQYSAQQFSSIYSKIDSVMHQDSPIKFNGNILITKGKQNLYQSSFGVQNFNTKTALKNTNRFEVMSITKQLTAVMMLKAVEDSKLNLEDSISKYLPDLKMAWKDSVKVYQLLNHTHGIVKLDQKLAYPAGSEFRYGNLSFALAGQILEQIYKKPYAEQATTFLKSLGFKNPEIFTNNSGLSNVKGHLINNEKIEVLEKSGIRPDFAAADGWLASTSELSFWNQLLYSGKILKNKSLQEFLKGKALSQHDVFGKEKQPYGYGIRVVNEQNIKYYGHTGLGDGFSALNIYIPKYDLSLVILENQMPENSDYYYNIETKIKNLLIDFLSKNPNPKF